MIDCEPTKKMIILGHAVRKCGIYIRCSYEHALILQTIFPSEAWEFDVAIEKVRVDD